MTAIEPMNVIRSVCVVERNVNLDTLESVLSLASEVAREGREGHRIGTLFVVSDEQETLKHSVCLILDPLQGHPDAVKHIADPNMRETVKELAKLDGAFIVSDAGIVLSAARFVNATAAGINIPLGLGSRHIAAASISRQTGAVAVVVSHSSVVRVFDDGQMVAEIAPDRWRGPGAPS